jgi:hypothetical protein
MDENIEALISRIKELEQELRDKLASKQEAFLYRLDRGTVHFEEKVKKRHQKLIKRLHSYIFDASLLNILTVPLIWGCLPPALLMDFATTIYQIVCFPVYGIPKVKRRQYIIIDRHALRYLNIIEKINCLYCGYFNGLISYIQEVAARTEQYWCPIKHARRVSAIHSRYKYFFDYGDGEEYRRKLEEVRCAFDDLTAEQNRREKGR